MAIVREAVIVEAVRTPLGRRNGMLKGWHPVDLLAKALNELFARTGVDPSIVNDNITGCVSQVGEQSINVGRNGWLAAGLPDHVPSTTVDRQCGSSQQAAHFIAPQLRPDLTRGALQGEPQTGDAAPPAPPGSDAG